MNIAEELRRLRKGTGLTQAQFAAVLGVAPSTVAQVETGARTPSMEVLRAWLENSGAELLFVPTGTPADPRSSLPIGEQDWLSHLHGLDDVGRRIVGLLAASWPRLPQEHKETLGALADLWAGRWARRDPLGGTGRRG